jgi:hypothetical protein
MRKGLILALTAISVLIILSSTLTPPAAAANSKLGVRMGDWIEYSISYYSTSPDFPESEYASDSYNRVRVEVIAIVGTTVTLRIAYFHADNETSSATWSGDISRNLCPYLIVAGLAAGDLVCTEGSNFLEIELADNETLCVTVSGAELRVRETVKMTILGTQSYVNVVEPSMALDAQVILYFDKTTGILVESQRSSLLFGWMVERITSTSVSFSVNPADFVWLWLGIGFAAVMGVVIVANIVKATKKRP